MSNTTISKSKKRAVKERLNKFLSVLLAFAMVLQTSPVAYARWDEGGVEGYTYEAPAPEEVTTTSEEPAPAPEPEPEPQVEEPAPLDEVAQNSSSIVATPEGQDVIEQTEDIAQEQAEQAPEEVMASISVYVENATLTIDGNQLTNSTGTLTTPEGKAISFAVAAVEGYELKEDSVKASVNGNEIALAGDGTYTLAADQVKTGTSIVVRAEKADTRTEYTYEDDYVRVTATLDKASAIPDDAVLSVTPIYENSTYYNYDAYMDALNDRVEGENVYDAQNTLLYDVAFLWVDPATGKTVELQPEEGAVTVRFTFRQRQLSDGIQAGSAANVEVNHLPLVDSAKADTTYQSTDIAAGDVVVEPMGANPTSLNTLEVRTDSFSVFAFSYTVDFTYDGYTLKLEGEGSIMLSQILGILNIPVSVADIAAVDFTNYDLLSFKRQGDDWKVTSLRSFVTPETLTITLANGDKYVIEVTDPVESSSLADFLTNAVITGATQNADGAYEVEQGKDYSIILSFAENSNFQFDNDATLTYQIPAGIAVINEQSGPLKINIVYKNRTYEVDATFHLDTDGILTVKFDERDPDYHRLEESTNVSFRFTYHAQFDNTETHIRFNELIERDIIFDEPEPAQAYVNKTGTFDETTGKFNYTITVTATGDVTNVNVKDVISGNALIFNNDVQVSGNSSGYTDNGARNGFDYTFASMREGETITITYSAGVDFSKDTDKDGKITVDQTKNTVTVKPDGGDPHNSEYSHEINYKSTSKGDGVDSGETTDDGKKIINWTIEYNKLALASAAGDTITDTISVGSKEYMTYYGDGITVERYNKDGQMAGSPETIRYDNLTFHNESSWVYTIPSTDTTPYRYVIKYQTAVDMQKIEDLGHPVILVNDGNGDFGSWTGTPDNMASISKRVSDQTEQYVEWESVITVPERGLTRAEVIDTVPAIWTPNAPSIPGPTRNIYEKYIADSLSIDGLLPDERYDPPVITDDRVVITFYYMENGVRHEGLKGTSGGHEITVKLKTEVDPDWLNENYTNPYNNSSNVHLNTISINGITDTAEARFSKQKIVKDGPKRVASQGSGDATLKNVIEWRGYTFFEYSLLLKSVKSDSVTITDSFDKSVLQIADPALVKGDQANLYRHMMMYYGDYQDQADHGGVSVSYSDTSDGLVINIDGMPKNADGQFYQNYKIHYYLQVRDGVDLEALAIANGGEYSIDNHATWNGHEDDFNYTVEYDYLNKELLNAGELGGSSRTAKYRITFNASKATLNGGEPMEMTDTLSKNLSIDYSSIQITTDPAGASVPYSLSGNPAGETVATYTVPDSTKVVITYDAQVVGNGSQKIVNKVSVNGKEDTIENTKDYGVAGEGDGAIASFKIVKVDGYDANKKLEGVKFKIFAENPTLNFGENADYAKEITLTTDENGEITLDGDAYDFYFNERYHVQEIEPLPDYGTIGFDYLVTLTTDMAQVDYGHYIYYYNDSMQIKNWPLEGLVVEKQVKSDDAADLDKYFTFRISILNDDGTVNTNYNEKNGDDQFENGVVEFQLKNREQKMFWGFEKGTKYKVEEILSGADGNKYATTVDYDIYNEEGEIVDHETESGKSHSGELTQSDETIVFTNSVDSKGGLKVTKAVTGAPSSASSKKFKFSVSDGTKWLDAGGNIVDGETWIEIADGETYTVAADKLPAGSVWTVTEDTEDAQIDGYALDASSVPADGKVTVVAGENDATVALKNDYTQEKGGLKVTKRVVSARSDDLTRNFTFNVSLSDTTISGTYGDMRFIDGVATVTLKGGESATAEGLPTGITYTITEESATGFKLTGITVDGEKADAAEGAISVTPSTVVFENTRETGDLEVTKTVRSDEDSDKTKNFSFKVTLSDTTISGTFGDMIFTAGVAEFQLADGQEKTAVGLPTGITYTVEEEAAQGFITTKTGDTGTISTTKATAAFVNTSADKPSFEKKVADVNDSEATLPEIQAIPNETWADSADHDLGDDVPFRLKATLPSDMSAYKQYHLTFEDQMESTLIYNGDAKVYDADGHEISGATVTPTDKGFMATVTWGNGESYLPEELNGAAVYVYFTAKLGSDDVEPAYGAHGNMNAAKLTYTNNATSDGYGPDHEGNTDWDNVIAFTYRVDFTKTDQTGDKAVNGAVFTLYKVMLDGSKVVVSEDNVGIGNVFSFKGLDDGTYVLEETTVPNGYRAADDITFTVTADHEVKLDGDGWSNTEAANTVGDPARDGVLTSLAGKRTESGEIDPNDINKNITFERTGEGLAATVMNDQNAKATIEATKKFESWDLFGDDARFEFRLAAGNATNLNGDPMGTSPMPAGDGAKAYATKANTTAKFGEIAYEVPGIYKYTVNEVDGGLPGVTYKTEDHTVTVTVNRPADNNNTLKATVTYDGGKDALEVENTFKPLKKAFEATKELTGREWTEADKFTFRLEAVTDGAPMPKGDGATAYATKASGKVATFGEIEFEKPGNYQYTIAEVAPDEATNADGVAYAQATDEQRAAGGFELDGITYDTTPHAVVIDVDKSQDSNDLEVYSLTYDNEESLTVTNEYEANGELNLTATKVVSGDDWPKDAKFTFMLADAQGTALGTATATADNPIAAFDAIKYEGIVDGSKLEYTYTITEVVPSNAVNEDGVTYAKATDEQKAAGGFMLDGITYAHQPMTVKVKLTDNGDGTLSYDVTSQVEGASTVIIDPTEGDTVTYMVGTFENEAYAREATVEFTKAFYGAEDGQITFRMTPYVDGAKADGTTAADTTKSPLVYSAAQHIEWTALVKAKSHTAVTSPAITFYKAGTYQYLIEEVTDKAGADEATILATIVVDEDQEPTVTYQVSPYKDAEFMDIDEATFYNNELVTLNFRSAGMRKFNANKMITVFQPEIRKVLENGILAGGEFKFELRDEAGNLVSEATNDENGRVEFAAIRYEEAGEHTYTITEVAGTDGTINYSDEAITLTVTVVETDGVLTATGAYTMDGKPVEIPTITNTYKTVGIHANKYSREDLEKGIKTPLEGAHYGLWMVNPDGADVYLGMQESDAGGNLWYDIPTLEGVVYYFKEEEPPPAGHLVDPYPTDYFTLLIEDGQFSLKYFASYEEAVAYTNENNG